MEQLFQDRLPEFYETLAFHTVKHALCPRAWNISRSRVKRALQRYAVEESHQYFRDAYEIFRAKTDKTDSEKAALIDMLNEWGYVFYYLGDIKEMDRYLQRLTKNWLNLWSDKARLGMFYAWLGIAYFTEGKPRKAII